jgi:hypothetical protein
MRKNNLLLAVFMIFFGWFLAGFGFTTTLGHPISTIFFCVGLGLFFLGFLLLFRVKK